MPWLSVIMPTYNGARFLAAALESVVGQLDDAIEVILVDDGSTDDTRPIAESFLSKLPLRIIASPRRGNWVAGTNEGMALAQGEYIGWLHQDDVWHSSRLGLLRDLVRRYPEADVLVHPVWFMDAGGRRVGKWRCPLPRAAGALSPPTVVEHLLVQDFFASTAPIFKSSAAARAGPLDESLWFLADWDFWLKLSGQGSTVYHPKALSSFRVHRGSQSMRRIEGYAEQYDVVLGRHLPRWKGVLPKLGAIAEAARFSADVNIAFARWAAGEPSGISRLAAQFLMLGPGGWRRYSRDSRIVERVVSRLRAGVLAAPGIRSQGSSCLQLSPHSEMGRTGRVVDAEAGIAQAGSTLATSQPTIDVSALT